MTSNGSFERPLDLAIGPATADLGLASPHPHTVPSQKFEAWGDFAQCYDTRHDVLASLMDIFPSDDRSKDVGKPHRSPHKVPHKVPHQSLQMAPQAISRAKVPSFCNIEREQLWRILDKQFGYGATLVIMQYWANEEVEAPDLFDERPETWARLEGVAVYQQPPEEFNHAFHQQNGLADHYGSALDEWFAAEKKAAADRTKELRHDTLSSIKGIFVGKEDYKEDCQEERKDEEMHDVQKWSEWNEGGWNDVWQNEEAGAPGFEGLFQDDSAFTFDDDWNPSGRLTTAVDLEARAEGSAFDMVF